jgi:pyrimidine operon attenuation protein/uracil phosphoribosyltransferase
MRFKVGDKKALLTTLPTGADMNKSLTQLASSKEMEQIIERLAGEVVAQRTTSSNLLLVGIQRRGVDLAHRLQQRIAPLLNVPLPIADLDINLYRDDWTSSSHAPVITPSSMPLDITDKVVLLVDDVLFTGRTIRAALDALLDFGRPRLVKLLVLIDRGHRELPIQADYIGRVVSTERSEHVDVRLLERDGEDGVYLTHS